MNQKVNNLYKDKDNEICILEIGTETFHLNNDRVYLIGRDTENIKHDIAINDQSIDIKHAIIKISKNNEINIIDICSKNGTYINDERLQNGEYIKLNNTDTLSKLIKFGNVEVNLKLLSEINQSADNQYLAITDLDIILPSQKSNISQTSRFESILKSSQNNNYNVGIATTSQRSKSTLEYNKSITNNNNNLDGSLLATSTQPYYQYNESIRKNIEILEEEDDFYIPETQEVFQRNHHKNDNSCYQRKIKEQLHKNEITKDKHQNIQKQNRIFDDTEYIHNNDVDNNDNETENFMIRINTQDYNVTINQQENSNSSDDLLRSVIIPHSSVTTANDDNVMNKEMNENNIKNNLENENNENNVAVGLNDINVNRYCNNDDDHDDETDCEEEMSKLQWNESSLSSSLRKTKPTIDDDNAMKSASVTPDNLEIFDNNTLNDKINEDKIPKSNSTTPDLDTNLLKQNNTKIENLRTTKSREQSSFKIDINIDKNDDFDTEFLPQTKSIISNEKQQKIISNQNKINLNIQVSNDYDNDDLDATQAFECDENLLNKIRLEYNIKEFQNIKNVTTNDKILTLQSNVKLFGTSGSVVTSSTSFVKPSNSLVTSTSTTVSKLNNVNITEANNINSNDDDCYLEPTQIFVPPVDNLNNNPTSTAQNDNDNVDDCYLEPTQIFVPPVDNLNNNPTSTSQNDNGNVDDCYLEPTQIFVPPVDNLNNNPTSTAQNDNDNDNVDDCYLEPTQIFVPPPSKKSINSCNSITELNSSQTQILTPFNFDICTPQMDCIKLPTEDNIKEAGKVYSMKKAELSKNHKHIKYMFEESNSSSSSDEYNDNMDNESHKKNSKNQNILKQNKINDNQKKNKKQQENIKQTKSIPNRIDFEKRITRSSVDCRSEKFSKINECNATNIKDSYVKVLRSNKNDTASINSDEMKNNETTKKSKNDNNNYNKKIQNDESLKDKNKRKINEKLLSTFEKIDEEVIITTKTKRRNQRISSNESVETSSSTHLNRKISSDSKRNYNKQTSSSSSSTTILKKIDEEVNKNDKSKRRNQKKNSNQSETSSSMLPSSSSSSSTLAATLKRSERISRDACSSLSNRYQKRFNDEQIENVIPNKRKKDQENTTKYSSLATSKFIQSKPNIMFTMIDSKKYANEIKMIGAKIVTNMHECTILITDRIYWTGKFMAAMAKRIPIVTPEWLIDSAITPNLIISLEKYLIKDYNNYEKKWNFNLRELFNLPQEKLLFEGYSFFITPNTSPTPEELILIIECGKGKILRKLPTINQNLDKFYVISDKKDINLWDKIRKNKKNVNIIYPMGIQIAVLRQLIDFKNYILS